MERPRQDRMRHPHQDLRTIRQEGSALGTAEAFDAGKGIVCSLGPAERRSRDRRQAGVGRALPPKAVALRRSQTAGPKRTDVPAWLGRGLFEFWRRRRAG